MYPKEYIQYLVHFHGDRDYFECHEILEEYWKQTDAGNKSSVWVGLIQLAVSCYHHRRGNFNGAEKTLRKAFAIFINKKQTLIDLGINQVSFIRLLKEQQVNIEQKRDYQSFNLPIESISLMENCLAACAQQGLAWCSSSDLK